MVEGSNELFDPQLMAKSIKTYLDMFDTYVIKTDLSVEDYDKARKTIKKLIKHLKNGDLDKVIDEERYEEALQRYYNQT